MNERTQGKKPQARMSFRKDLVRNHALYLLAVPGIIYFLVFSYAPMAGIVIAFKDYNVMDGIFGSPWAGFKNFEFLFKTQEVYRVIFNTVFLNLLFIVFGTACQVGISLLLNEMPFKRLKKINQSLLLFPYFISWVIVGVISAYIFGTDTGYLNNMLRQLGLEGVEWYKSPQYWPMILTITYIWKWVGYGSVIYLSAIVGVDPQIYESAQTDGCNRWQLIRYITLPSILPTICIMSLLAVGRIFYGDFGMVLNMVGSNVLLFPTTNIIDTYVYRALQGSGGQSIGNIGMASAAGLVQSLLGFITILVANRIVRGVDKDYALY